MTGLLVRASAKLGVATLKSLRAQNVEFLTERGNIVVDEAMAARQSAVMSS